MIACLNFSKLQDGQSLHFAFGIVPSMDEIADVAPCREQGSDHLLSRFDHKFSATETAHRCSGSLKGRRSNTHWSDMKR